MSAKRFAWFWLLALSISFLTLPALAAEAEELPRGPRLGVWPSGLPTDSLLEARGEEQGVFVRLVADWAEVEKRSEVYDWTDIRAGVMALHGSGHRVVLCLTGGHPEHTGGRPPAPEIEGALDAWDAFVRSAVRAFDRELSVLEIWDGPTGFDPGSYAFLLKRSTLAARAEADAVGGSLWVAQGAITIDHLDWQRALWAEDASAYVDILPLRMASDDRGVIGESIRSITQEALAFPPAPSLWAYVESDPADPWAAPFVAARALAEGASVALAGSPAEGVAGDEVARWVLGADSLLGKGYGAAPLGNLAVRTSGGADVPGGGASARFLSDEDFSSLIVMRSGRSSEETVDLVVDSRTVRNARYVDLIEGRELRTAARTVDGDDKKRRLRVPVRDYPLLVTFQKAVVSPGFELPPEELEVERERGLTAEEIIARYQGVQKIQDDRLDRWTARGRVDFHFQLAQGGSNVDITIESNYFWERGKELEWEQTDYYINGNELTWDKIPELPLIQPEKVITLPLDLTLDKTYAYRLVGEGDVGGRAAYILAFDPVEMLEGQSLYRGRLWIDRENFQRLKVSLVQTNLDLPVRSNEESDLFAPFEGPDGEDYWMMKDITGQQIWVVAGRSFVVQREVVFTDFQINPPKAEFDARLAEAYAGNNQMLRDTAEGFRYLERLEDGTVRPAEPDTSQLFAAAGVFKDRSIDSVVPLAGINYFNYDLFDRDIQLNVLFAGVLGFVTLSKPGLFGGKVDATVDLTATALDFQDTIFAEGNESEFEEIETQPQNIALRLGVPAGQFVRFNLIGRATRRTFSVFDDAQNALDGFNTRNGVDWGYQLPSDHTLTTGAVEIEFNRKGWALTGSYERAKRSDWRPFGLLDRQALTAGSPTPFLEFQGGDFNDPANYQAVAIPELLDDFSRWGLSGFKEWFLTNFQKARVGFDYLDGEDLDRFSQYEFSFFGDDQLNGFSGSGVRFDRGTILRTGYSFNVFEAIRIDANLDTARVERGLGVDDQSFTGFGLNANFIGPWKTVINVSYGIALDSDIPSLENEQEFLVFVFKLF